VITNKFIFNILLVKLRSAKEEAAAHSENEDNWDMAAGASTPSNRKRRRCKNR
jgi:hypothetical protein